MKIMSLVYAKKSDEIRMCFTCASRVSTSIGDSQLCFLRFDSMKSTMCLLDGGTHYHREAHRILQ